MSHGSCTRGFVPFHDPGPIETRSGDPPIADDPKTYSDEEFALILRRASEMARSPESEPTARARSEGLSLTEMKEIAAEAGLDPALVERAARLIPSAHPSTALERIVGAPVKIRMGAEYDAPLSRERSEALLTLVRASVEQQGEGEATASGLNWHSVGEGTQVLVSIHSEGDRTHLRVVADRSGALAITGIIGVLGSLAAGIVVLVAGEVSGIQVHPLVGIGLTAGGAGGVLAGARAFWKATSRQVHARAAALVEKLGGALEKLD